MQCHSSKGYTQAFLVIRLFYGKITLRRCVLVLCNRDNYCHSTIVLQHSSKMTLEHDDFYYLCKGLNYMPLLEVSSSKAFTPTHFADFICSGPVRKFTFMKWVNMNCLIHRSTQKWNSCSEVTHCEGSLLCKLIDINFMCWLQCTRHSANAPSKFHLMLPYWWQVIKLLCCGPLQGYLLSKAFSFASKLWRLGQWVNQRPGQCFLFMIITLNMQFTM